MIVCYINVHLLLLLLLLHISAKAATDTKKANNIISTEFTNIENASFSNTLLMGMLTYTVNEIGWLSKV